MVTTSQGARCTCGHPPPSAACTCVKKILTDYK
jgi:hypothetical protein